MPATQISFTLAQQATVRVDKRYRFVSRVFSVNPQPDFWDANIWHSSIDAPELLPTGSTRVLGLEEGYPYVHGHGIFRSGVLS